MSFLRELFFIDTDNIIIQLFRYTIVGGVSFLVDYALLFTLTEYLHLHYLLSATISFVAGLVVNYLISTSWIFRHSKLKSRSSEFMIYGVIGVIGLLLNNLLLYVFTDWMGIHYMFSKLITAVLVMGWNFMGRKFILFNPK